MLMEHTVKFIREHQEHIEELAAEGNPLARAIVVLYDLHLNDPGNITVGNVLALAVHEYKGTGCIKPVLCSVLV